MKKVNLILLALFMALVMAGTPDFRISVQSEKEGGMHILVHAFGHAGDALDFVVKENSLIPFRGVR